MRPSLDDPVHDASVNLMGTLNVLECAAKVGLRKIDLRGQRRHDLRRAETAARQGIGRPRAPSRSAPTASRRRSSLDYLGFYQRYRGLDFTACALANVYGPRQDPLRRGGRDRDLRRRRCSPGRRRRSTATGTRPATSCSSTTSAHAFVQAMDRGSGKLVNIGTGLETSVRRPLQAARAAHRVRRGAGARGAAARGAPPDRAGHLGRGQGARVEAVDPPRGRARRDRRLPEGDLMADARSRGHRAGRQARTSASPRS